ncbi:MAG: S8 family serine peptidase, partial [Planctomycetota bacterium]|nr:S8 family serine peptidase [Planctomycetota bacterium]
ARALPPGTTMVWADPGQADDVSGQGPAAIGSDDFRDGGADGVGMTIAVIDGGYENLTEARANGDAPSTGSSTQINLTSNSFESGGIHGTGCVEAAYDHCPAASWRIYKTNSSTDIGTAVEDAIENGVHVITMSLSYYNKGWEDDTGAPSEAATLAAENGILFFTSAGNRARQHWKGDFEPGAGDPDWHNFDAGNEVLPVTIGGDDGVNLYLCWDTGAGTCDYDLYIYDSSLTLIDKSDSNGETFENLSFSNPSSSSTEILIAVWRKSGPAVEFELFGHASGTNTWSTYVSTGSTTSPSNSSNQSVISVAAVDWANFSSSSPSAKSYSSRGPSNSGMTVPDLTGPTDTRGFTYSSFGGTSSATPNTAGAACALWSAVPQLTNHELRVLLYGMADDYRDWGAGGNDSTFGWGGAKISPTAVRDTSSPPIYFVENLPFGLATGTFGSPYLTLGAAAAAVPAGATVMMRGGTYSETPTITKRLDIYSWDGNAVVR